MEFEVEGAPGYEESLSLTLHNFGDGSEFDAGLCWFEIKEKTIFRRQHLRACLNARIAMQERSNRLRQSERGCGQCGFRAVMRQLLANRGVRLNKHDAAVSLDQIKECRQIIGRSLINNAEVLSRVLGGSGAEASPEALRLLGEKTMAASPEPCLDRVDLWYGGPNIAHSAALAMAEKIPVYNLTEGSTTVR